MRLLLDQKVAVRCVVLLGEDGHEVEHIRDLGMTLSDDTDIRGLARVRLLPLGG